MPTSNVHMTFILLTLANDSVVEDLNNNDTPYLPHSTGSTFNDIDRLVANHLRDTQHSA